MNRKYTVQLTEEERSQLQQIVSAGTAPARKIRRAQILLKSDSSPEGPNWSCQAICAAFDVSATTVTNVRKAYCQGGLEAALNRRKPARQYPRRLDGEAEAHLIALACSQPPEGHARWTLRLLRHRFVEAGYVERVSHETIRQVLKKRTQALAEETVLHPSQGQCRLCVPDGRGVGGISAALRPPTAPGLHG